MFERVRKVLVTILGIGLCLFTLLEVNFPRLQAQSAYAIFVMLGMVLCFLVFPILKRFKDNESIKWLDVVLALLTTLCCGYAVVQNEEMFKSFWVGGIKLGDRAGAETTMDFAIALTGILLVLETTRRSIGWIVPALALAFISQDFYCYLSETHGLPQLPAFLFPHSGHSLKDVATTAFFKDTGVFGVAASVMFKYVMLFVVFGAFLEMSGATKYIIDFSQLVFGRLTGGPAMVSVMGSGLMGSLSGSAVANAVTTGAFTIPMMRNAGFRKDVAGGITAAAASGGALVPPVMGAGAYMMLELVKPQVTFLDIMRAAVIPALLYYFSLFMIVLFYSRRVGAVAADEKKTGDVQSIWRFEGLIFFAALATLVGLLLFPVTPFKAVTGSLVVILLLSAARRQLVKGVDFTPFARIGVLASFALVALLYLLYLAVATDTFSRIENGRQVFALLLDASFAGMFGFLAFGFVHPSWRKPVVAALTKSANNGIALVAASACVGIIIAVVDSTGVAADFNAKIKGVVEESLFIALVGIMFCSIILGMGVPSVVCYLLMATLMGALLQELGVIPLGAHLFIFYFGMMSMVTPPVALAAYASASIAEAKIMRTALAAFRFALVGFTLPFMFVYRPALLLMNGEAWNKWTEAGNPESGPVLDKAMAAWPSAANVAIAVGTSVIGITALAAGIAGYLAGRLSWVSRIALFLAAGLLLSPDTSLGAIVKTIMFFLPESLEQDFEPLLNTPLFSFNLGPMMNILGGALFVAIAIINWRFGKRSEA